MGHSRLGVPPRTRSWNEIASLIAAGAGVEQLVRMLLDATEKTLNLSPDDHGFVEALWLLMRLPTAAKSSDFVKALGALGMKVESDTTLADITAAFAQSIDHSMRATGGRTVLSEIAEMAAIETINSIVERKLPSLYSADTKEIQAAFAGLDTVKQFGGLAREFMARLSERLIGHFLCAETLKHVGPDGRFLSLDDHSSFEAALSTHCYEAAVIVERFSGEWRSKENFEAGSISREAAKRFAHGATMKLTSELRARTVSHAG